jgi:hypothetical protein
MRHHALEGREMVCHTSPTLIGGTHFNERSAPIDKQRTWTERRAMPNGFALDLGIEAESRCIGRWETHVDQIPVLVTRESETKIDGVRSPGSLNRIIASAHRARDGFRPCPQR